jgi:ATP-binding protein involved in chromosome partitioning
MAELNEQMVLAALAGVQDPDRGQSIVALNMVTGININDGRVSFAIEVAPERGAQLEPLRQAAAAAVEAMDGVSGVTAVLTAARPSGQQAAASQSKPRAPYPQFPGKTTAPQAAPPKAPEPGRPSQGPGSPGGKALVPGVKHIIAVASGKGGVGKSTTTVNIAMALAAAGLKIGIMDADIYGPSMPRMMGITGKPESKDGKTLIPMENYGVKVMSMGFMVAEDTPMIWRGPMVMSALEQMLRDVAWGELDVLVVDMPPGTGDAQLTMAQRVPLSGTVIVSTPQDIALLDARKGLNMFRKVDVPVLGIIENMSYFACPHCGERTDIFSHGGAREEADRLGCDFLGEIPLDIRIRETSDSGHPIVVTDPEGAHAAVYRSIADSLWQKLAGESRTAPRIVMN